MKRVIAFGVILVILVIGVSFYMNNPISTGEDTDNSQETIELSKNGITMLVPGDWEEASSSSNTTVIAAADPNSKDSVGYSTINVNVEKKTTSNSLSHEFNSNYDTLARNTDYDILYEGNVSIAGVEGMEAGYTSSSTGFLKQHKAIWFKKDSDLYVILCTAPESNFAEEESTFDFIINNIEFN